MYIQITKNDCQNIVNKNLQGGGSNSELEKALAKKCLSLYEKLGQINNERNELFECLYGIGIKISKGRFADQFAAKRKADLMKQSKSHYKAMLETARTAESINIDKTNETSNSTEA